MVNHTCQLFSCLADDLDLNLLINNTGANREIDIPNLFEIANDLFKTFNVFLINF